MPPLPPEDPPKIPRPRSGPLHVLDAAGYSLAGARRLWAETAARLELGGAALAFLAFWARGASAGQYLILIALLAAVLVVEALNTALEVLTDHVSPGWSRAAKEAKDLGSLAVAVVLLLTIGFVALVLFG